MCFLFAQIACIYVILNSLSEIVGEYEYSLPEIRENVAIMKTRILDIYFFTAGFVIKRMDKLARDSSGK